MKETVMQNMIMTVGAFSGGFLVAGGVIALIVGLGIITRLVGITHTAKENRWYETMIFLGAVYGNCLTVYQIPALFGRTGLLVLGLCAGIYTGGWIMALAEMVHIFRNYNRNRSDCLEPGFGKNNWQSASIL